MTADLHTRRAAQMFDVSVEDVTDTQRRIAKRANYSAPYSASLPKTLKEAWWFGKKRSSIDDHKAED